MIETRQSLVLESGVVAAAEAAADLRARLSLTTDAADVHEDLRNGAPGITVIDARRPELYVAGHVPGAISFPHRTMDAESTSSLRREHVFVVYCDGIGCNASTKGALKLAQLGFKVKEMLGGLDWWRRDGYPVAIGTEPGTLAETADRCGC
jgi:rhodanese-related sulfurtransferase